MLIYSIRNRLHAVEQVKKNTDVPEVVIISWNDDKKHWIAKEQYIKKNSKGILIPRTGKNRYVSLESPEDYTPPVGFRGSIIIERNIE